MGFDSLAKSLIIFGIILVILGLLLSVAHKVPYLGKLPGDILVEKKNFTLYFPLATSLLISAILSVIFCIWGRR